ncbi:PDZ domain-containing protein [Sphingomonas sp. BK345]|uniref:PDZ domain-containing protein n=1 Tax=Sphingomonas sp. BK345 TaxID=2586980 RepID=UPI00161CDB28|nr:PDZ domain-containing protein [Sphingomonas sp. BK345]MBB3475395.1 hypothetical protein [Sphingomonas sp. BK345]
MFLSLIALATAIATPDTPVTNAAEGDGRCRLDTGWHHVALRSSKGLVIPGAVGGRRTSMLIDTGSPDTVVDQRLAPPAGANEPVIEEHWNVGTFRVTRRRNLAIIVAGHRVDLRQYEATDLSSQDAGEGSPGVIIGQDLLSSCVIDIDSDRQRVRVRPPGQSQQADTTLELTAFAGSTYMMTQIRTPSGRIYPAEIDTGSQIELEMDERLIGEAGFLSSPVTTTVMPSSNQTFIVRNIIRAPSIGLGKEGAADLEVYIHKRDPTSTFLSTIGLPLLSRFNVSIDLKNRLLQLGRRATPASPQPRSTTGVVATPSDRQLKVLHVMNNSPALEAGLRPGDRICKVNNHAIPKHYFRSNFIGWQSAPAGQNITLYLCDGRVVHIKSKVFY